MQYPDKKTIRERCYLIPKINFSLQGWQKDYFNYFYASKDDWEDLTRTFWRLLARSLPKPPAEVLEIGAGTTNSTTQIVSSWGLRITGLDVDNKVLSNLYLSKAYTYDGKKFPFSNQTFDASFSNNVDEHIEFPKKYLREIKRVLKPRGVYVSRCSNFLHYSYFFSYFIPPSLRPKLLKWVCPGRNIKTFRSLYRMNTLHTIKRLSNRLGFQIQEIYSVEANPAYLNFLRYAYLLGVFWERIVNSSNFFQPFRACINYCLKKP